MDKNFESRFPNDALDNNRRIVSIVVMDGTANIMDVTLPGSKN